MSEMTRKLLIELTKESIPTSLRKSVVHSIRQFPFHILKLIKWGA